MKKNLRYCMLTAGIGCHEDRHPQVVMKELGITYTHSTPQSLADQWWFWNCENVPESLPKFLTELTIDPHKANGVDKAEADEIANYNPTKADPSGPPPAAPVL